MSEKINLKVENLSASYKTKRSAGRKTDMHEKIINDMSFIAKSGELVCICGPNGCGKSTLLSVLAGVPGAALKVTGRVLMESGDGIAKGGSPDSPVEISHMKVGERAKLIAYMQQTELSVWDFNVFDYVLQGRFAHSGGGHYTNCDKKIVRDVLEELGLAVFAARTLHTLSGGEFQKIRIARAFAQQPRFMLLDEPAASLDYVYEPHLMGLLRDAAWSKNIGIIVSVHDINLAMAFADKIMLLPPEKAAIFGSPDDIMNVENLKITFGVDFTCQKTECFQSLQ